MSLDSILGASEHMLDCAVLLYELKERPNIPSMPIDISYLQARLVLKKLYSLR